MSLLSESLVKFTDDLSLVKDEELAVERFEFFDAAAALVSCVERFEFFDAAALASCAFRSSLFFFLSFSCSLASLALEETFCSRPDVRGILLY